MPRKALLSLAISFLVVTSLAASDLVNFTTVPNTDFAMFGAGGMRGQGTGSIVVTGISGTVTVAYLYWMGPTNDTGDANAAVTFNGTAITGTNIGNSDNNCWGFQNSKAYRANVTSLVSGNGTYTLANFRKTSPVADVNGVSLSGPARMGGDLTIGSASISNFAIGFADAPTFRTLGLTKEPALILGMSELRVFKRVAIDFQQRLRRVSDLLPQPRPEPAGQDEGVAPRAHGRTSSS